MFIPIEPGVLCTACLVGQFWAPSCTPLHWRQPVLCSIDTSVQQALVPEPVVVEENNYEKYIELRLQR